MPARQLRLDWGKPSHSATVLPGPMPKPLPDVSRLFDDEDRRGDRVQFNQSLRPAMHQPRGSSVSRPRSGLANRRSGTPQPSYSQRAMSRLDQSAMAADAHQHQAPFVYSQQAPVTVSSACQTEVVGSPAGMFVMTGNATAPSTPGIPRSRGMRPTFALGEDALAQSVTDPPMSGRLTHRAGSSAQDAPLTPVDSRLSGTGSAARRGSVASVGSAADTTELVERRRKSLMRLMRMNADEISALGAIEDTIAKVGDDAYDLQDDVPASPQHGAAAGADAAFGEQVMSPTSPADVADSRRVRKDFTEDIPGAVVGMSEAEQPKAGAGKALTEVTAILSRAAEALSRVADAPAASHIAESGIFEHPGESGEHQRSPSPGSGPEDKDESVAGRLLAEVPDTVLDDASATVGSVDEALALCRAALRIADSTLRNEVQRHERDLRDAKRALTAAKAQHLDTVDELDFLSAAMRRLGVVPAINGVVAPHGDDVERITVAFLDVPQADALWSRSPAATKTALQAVTAVARQHMKRCRGYEMMANADEMAVVFTTPREALDWALLVQHALVHEAWPPELLKWPECAADTRMVFRGLRVRIGVHVGEADATFDPRRQRLVFDGDAPLCAAGLCGLAPPGLVAVSGQCLAALGDTTLGELATRGGAASRTLGQTQLRNGDTTTPVLITPASLRARLPMVHEMLESVTRSAVSQLARAARGADEDDDEDETPSGKPGGACGGGGASQPGALVLDGQTTVTGSLPVLAPEPLQMTPSTAFSPKQLSCEYGFATRFAATMQHATQCVERATGLLARRHSPSVARSGLAEMSARHSQLGFVTVRISKSDAIYRSDPSALTKASAALEMLLAAGAPGTAYKTSVIASFVDTFVVAVHGGDDPAAFAARWALRMQLAAMDVKYPASLRKMDETADVYTAGRRVFAGLRLHMGVAAGGIKGANDNEASLVDEGVVRRALAFMHVAQPGEVVIDDATSGSLAGTDYAAQPVSLDPSLNPVKVGASYSGIAVVPASAKERHAVTSLRGHRAMREVAWPDSPLIDLCTHELAEQQAAVDALKRAHHTLVDLAAAPAGVSPPPASQATFVAVDFVSPLHGIQNVLAKHNSFGGGGGSVAHSRRPSHDGAIALSGRDSPIGAKWRPRRLVMSRHEVDLVTQQLKVFAQTVRRVTERHGGYEAAFDLDSIVLAFPSPADAVAAAVDANGELRVAHWPAINRGTPSPQSAVLTPAGGGLLGLPQVPERRVSNASSLASSQPGSGIGRRRRSSGSLVERCGARFGISHSSQMRAVVSPVSRRTAYFGWGVHAAVHLAALAAPERIYIAGATLFQVADDLPSVASTSVQGSRHLPGDLRGAHTEVHDIWFNGSSHAPETQLPPEAQNCMHKWGSVRTDRATVEFVLQHRETALLASAAAAPEPEPEPELTAAHAVKPKAGMPEELVEPLVSLLLADATLLVRPSELFRLAPLRLEWLTRVSAVVDALMAVDGWRAPAELRQLALPSPDELESALGAEAADERERKAETDESAKRGRRKSRIMRVPGSGLASSGSVGPGGSSGGGADTAENAKLKGQLEQLRKSATAFITDVNMSATMLNSTLDVTRAYVALLTDDERNMALPSEEELTRRFVDKLKSSAPSAILTDDDKRRPVDRVFLKVATFGKEAVRRKSFVGTVSSGKSSFDADAAASALRGLAGLAARFQQAVIRSTRRVVAMRRAGGSTSASFTLENTPSTAALSGSSTLAPSGTSGQKGRQRARSMTGPRRKSAVSVSEPADDQFYFSRNDEDGAEESGGFSSNFVAFPTATTPSDPLEIDGSTVASPPSAALEGAPADAPTLTLNDGTAPPGVPSFQTDFVLTPPTPHAAGGQQTASKEESMNAFVAFS